jgi:tetratricopeptide (TPR) repeat protein
MTGDRLRPARPVGLLVVLVLLAAGRPAAAEDGILFVHLTDPQDRPLAGVHIGPAGKGSPTVTDGAGRGRIRLPPEIHSSQEIELEVAAGSGPSAWVFISPWNRRARVPPFAGSEAVDIVLAHPGNRLDLLESVSGRLAIEKTILTKIAERTTKEEISEEQRRRVLAEQAAVYRLTPEEINRTIREHGPKSPDLEEQGLAALYDRNYPLATRDLSAELEHREQDLKQAAERVADTAFFLAQSLVGEGHYHQAVVALQRADSLRPDSRSVLDSLGWALLDDGQLTEARKTFVRAASASSAAAASPESDLEPTEGLAACLEALGDFSGARKLQDQVLDARRRLLGVDHPDTLSAMSSLAATLSDQGDLPGARKLEEQVLDTRRRILGLDHLDTLSAMNNLANTLSDQGDLPGARKLREQVLDTRRRILGPDHPDTFSAMSNLANTLSGQGDLPGARKLQEQVIDARRRILGVDHPDTLSAMSNMAATLWDQGDFPGARKLQEQVLDARGRILGPDHPDTLTAMNNLAATLWKQGDLPSARRLEEQVLGARRRILGPRHPDATSSEWNLLLLVTELNDATATIDLVEHLRWLLDADEKALSSDQRQIRDSLRASGRAALPHQPQR